MGLPISQHWADGSAIAVDGSGNSEDDALLYIPFVASYHTRVKRRGGDNCNLICRQHTVLKFTVERKYLDERSLLGIFSWLSKIKCRKYRSFFSLCVPSQGVQQMHASLFSLQVIKAKKIGAYCLY
ncbi:jg4410 [Pararge aegeria aegeria]|uniref:Jg4410 protein n=1 Tax=Pararge aegeria aegeria TaxID=348720 RepID=A0A8S4RLM0_9NEOP|nr:jg4410 [Pararge aegeria aegeria]